MRTTLLFALCLCGCARPNYEMTANPPLQIAGPVNKGAETALDCMTVLAGTNQCLSLRWTARQTKTTFGAFVFKVWRPNAYDGSAVLEDPPGNTIKVRLWMPSMGHGASPLKITRIDTGTFLAEKVFFSMTGDWEIRFQLAAEAHEPFRDAAIVPFTF